ncbi:hypothetical protein P879_05791 [Paragonimus westermani]|uniref:Kinase n=1 Tax=Paragonimus westermani TaxID=34504 RepID=A0A8T0D9R6_9TREM|nr:hypothetical protein P879_05791 [Paragonimus westermani]
MELSHYTLLPAGVFPYAFQVAGHKSTTSSCDMLRHPSQSIVYKRLQDNSRGLREVNFYKNVYATNVSEPLRMLRSFLPEFYGVYRCPQSQDLYLGLSDVMATFQHPNVCDVKLGTVTYRPQTEANKIQREQSKYPWRRALGFHITGMQLDVEILDPAFSESRLKISWCGPFTAATTLLPFFGSDPARHARLSLAYADELVRLSNWYEQYGASMFSFCRTSVLLGHDCSSPLQDNHIVVTLIDFTDWADRSAIVNSPDPVDQELTTGFAHGLSVLTKMIRRIALQSNAETRCDHQLPLLSQLPLCTDQ